MTDSGPLLETLKSMILDFQEMELQTGVPRRLRIETVRGKATVCIGVRRSGKSTYLYQSIARLLEQGVPRRNVLYLDFFDDRLHRLRHRLSRWCRPGGSCSTPIPLGTERDRAR